MSTAPKYIIDGQLKEVPYLDFPEFLAGAGSLRSTTNDLLAFLAAFSGRDYFIPQADVQVTFQLDGQGPAKGLILHLYGQFNFPAKRIDAGIGKK